MAMVVGLFPHTEIARMSLMNLVLEEVVRQDAGTCLGIVVGMGVIA